MCDPQLTSVPRLLVHRPASDGLRALQWWPDHNLTADATLSKDGSGRRLPTADGGFGVPAAAEEIG